MRIKINDPTIKLDGLFKFLFSSYLEESVFKIVKVSASSTETGHGLPSTIINPNANKSTYDRAWLSKNEENSNITLSFIRHQFAIDSYTIQSRSGIDYNYPLEWVLEATNDMHNWKEIHHKPNNTDLEGSDTVCHYESSDKNFYSTFRFTMIGVNYHLYEDESYMFGFRSLEFFGSLYDIRCTIPGKYFIRFLYSLFFFVFFLK